MGFLDACLPVRCRRALGRVFSNALLGRLSAAAVLLIAEYELLAVRFDGGALAASHHPWAAVGNLGIAVSLGITIATGGALLTRGRFLEELSGSAASIGRFDARWGLAHVGAYVAFALCSAKIFASDGPGAFNPWWLLAWVMCGAVTVGSLLGFVARTQAARIARVLMRVAGAGLAIGTLAWFIAVRATDLWPRAAGVSLRGVEWLLRITGGAVVIDASRYVVGADGFSVEIAPLCSGIEGMALSLVFVAGYLLKFRKHLLFPRALVLVPVAVAVAFAANVLRITLLVLVGAHVSPEVAYGGFHSKAGWFLFCGIALSLVATAEWTGVFARRTETALASGATDPTPAYLLPELALLTVSLFTGLFASGVDFLYPVRIFVAAGVLFAVGRRLRGAVEVPSLAAVPLGVAVFGVWLLLSPHDGSPLGAELRDGLLRWSPPMRAAFVFSRILGSVLVVPIAEELAFRGYLQRRIVSEDFASASLRRVTVASVVGTALCFGALHQAVVAAMTASLVYSAAGYLRGRLVDAVAAHATTNALIAVWVLAMGRWDLWT